MNVFRTRNHATQNPHEPETANEEITRTAKEKIELSRRQFLAATGASLAAGGVLGQMTSSPAAAQGGGGGAGRGGGRGGNSGAANSDPPKVAPPDVPNRPLARPMPELEDAPPRPPDQRVGFAVVGLGSFALNQIIPSFAESKNAKLVALVSGDASKATRVAQQHGIKPQNIYNYGNFDRIRDNPEIQVVYVITPPSLHREFTVRAARAGKHVFCEKPMAPTVADCQAMIEACRTANRKLMIAYRAHFQSHNVEAIRLARTREFGPLVSIVADHCRQTDPTKPADQWRLQKDLAGGGALFDIGIYSLNACRYLTGEEPVEISAMMHSPPNDPRFREVEATVHWTMRFPSGVLANCTTSFNSHDVKRYRVFCERGWFELDPATEYQGNQMRIGRKADSQSAADNTQEEPKIKENNQFAAEMDHFAECVQQNRTPKTPGEEGLQDVRLMTLIYEAARTGRVVRV